MASNTIEDLLRGRGAWLKAAKVDSDGALQRSDLTKLIGSYYTQFELLRDLALSPPEQVSIAEFERRAHEANALTIGSLLRANAMIGVGPDDRLMLDKKGRRYLTGGWLEELAWLAALSAGADEALYGQVIGWEAKGYTGENEIDLIMRKGDSLSFVSCKALRSELDINDKKHRNRLMDAVHEADNLADHFGREGEKVAVLVSTDLYDELRDTARYQALMGKAAVLDVRLIALEEMRWDKLVEAIQSLM